MTGRSRALAASLALAAAACAPKPQAQHAWQPTWQPPPPARESWKTFEDRWLRIKVPDTWEASRTAQSPGISTTWRIAPSGSRGSLLMWGIITVTMYEDGREKRPLKAIFKEAFSGRQRPAGPSKRTRMGKGECLAYRAVTPSGTCTAPGASYAPGAAGSGTAPAACVESWLQMRCYGRGRRYFEVQCALGRHPDGEPDAATQERLRWADWVLSGLEVR